MYVYVYVSCVVRRGAGTHEDVLNVHTGTF